MKKSHLKKIIAPIIISLLLILYYAFFGVVLFTQSDIPAVARIVGIILPLCLMGVMIYVLCERLKEIKRGEEDDLGKY